MDLIDNKTIMFKAIRTTGLSKYVRIAKEGVLFEYIAAYANDHEFVSNFLTIINTLQTFRNELNEDELVLLVEYESMLEMLNQKCSNNELDNTERIIYLMLLSYSLINNFNYDIEGISNYIKNVYNKGNVYYVPEELFLIFANTINYLNKEYDNSVSLVFEDNNDKICSYRFKKGKREIAVGGLFMRIIKSFANKKSGNYYAILYYVVFAVMHEFYHSIQFPFGIQNMLGVDNPIYHKEGLVALFNVDFYNQFHNNFTFEQDADEFAFSNIDKVLLDFMDDRRIKKSKNKVVCFKRLSEGSLKARQKEFAEKLNQAYEDLGGIPEKELYRSGYNGSN